MLAVPARARAQECDVAATARLPLVERPAEGDSGTALVVLLTGDGGWANSDEQVARGMVARGGAVIGLNMRSYLKDRKTPDTVAHDVACLTSLYLARWHRTRVMLLGYSRGADIAPFVATRLPGDLRARLNMLAMVSLAPAANFQFHLIDLLRDVKRSDDVPVRPELEKLRGLNMLCIYGVDDETSACPSLPGDLVRSIGRTGGHRITGGFEVMADALAEGLRASPKPPA
jgi:type IV secretory pathway VirJ component